MCKRNIFDLQFAFDSVVHDICICTNCVNYYFPLSPTTLDIGIGYWILDIGYSHCYWQYSHIDNIPILPANKETMEKFTNL